MIDLNSLIAERVRQPVAERVQRVGYRLYFRATALNYKHRVVARRNQTPVGELYCYELLNRHGDDEMLAAVDRHCGPSDTVYDVGANVGIYSVSLALNGVQNVYAFEPSPVAVTQCVANIARNGVGEQVAVHAYGLGETDKTRVFYRSTYPELSGFERASATRWGAVVEEHHMVPVRRIDGISLPAPDLLKIDVEGAELSVLRGARETLDKENPTIIIEIHETGLPGNRRENLRSFLTDRGYRISEHDSYWVCQ